MLQKKPAGWRSYDWTEDFEENYNIYQDDDDNFWYVPVFYNTDCPRCHGTGEIEDWLAFDDDDGYEVCPVCDGEGIVAAEYFDEAMSFDEFCGYQTQRLLLKRRYGTTEPKSIHDFWVRGQLEPTGTVK